MERARLKSLVLQLPGACERSGTVFLTDPHWPAATRAALDSLVGAAPDGVSDTGWLCLPTGGTSGGLRFARHDEATITAAVSGFCRHFGVQRVNAVGVLPLHHVSGLMARLRCELTGGRYVQADWKGLSSGGWPELPAGAGAWFLSLVPTQLQRLLELPDGPAFLRRFHAVFLGGAPTWGTLAHAAAAARVPVSLSYGMTETAAMIAAQQPQDFLKGDRDVGRPMPHADVSVDAEAGGVFRISGESVFRGYFPEQHASRSFLTEDLGEVLTGGRLRVLGRRDAVIITGGEKVAPLEVEEALRATGAFADVAVIGVEDPEWGQAVVACYPADGLRGDLNDVRSALGGHLARYKIPKRFVPVSPWPRNAQGKVNRAALLQAAAT